VYWHPRFRTSGIHGDAVSLINHFHTTLRKNGSRVRAQDNT